MAGKYATQPNKKSITAWILVAVALIAGAVGIVAAKYIANYQKEAEIHASSFHFSSNYLEYDAAPEYTLLDTGSHSVEFLLYNYQKENTALVSDMEIPYEISVSEGWSVAVTDAQGNPVTERKLPANTATHHTVTVTRAAPTGSTVYVTVTSTAPYTMELAAEFILEASQGVTYSVTDMGDYDVMTVYANHYAGSVSVGWDSDTHSPDNANPLMSAWTDTAESGSFTAEAFSVYTFIFVENQPDSYTADNFIVTSGV